MSVRKYAGASIVLLLTLCVCHGGPVRRAPAPGAMQDNAEAPLTNASVIKLVRAGFREKTVIAIIRARPVRFDLAPDRLIELKKNNVSEKIILAMLARGDEAALPARDGWEDEPLFGDDGDLPGTKRAGKSDPGEVNIFGSSGGTRGRTRTRGGNGTTDGDTQTTGSATVRILPAPSETGGARPVLEKTPTLTNDSVVELVEAGFTEGTIIRRIEGSATDFDLAPQKLAELRRRRVSEPVIAAMRAAMSDGAPAASKPEK